MKNCIECNKEISKLEDFHSGRFLKYPLCAEHLKWIKGVRKAGKPAKLLYLELKSYGIPAILEFNDNGQKTVDIGIPEYNMFIEVDGPEHHRMPRAMTDLQRTLFSWKDNIHTIRIPNNLANSDLSRKNAVKLIATMIRKHGKSAIRTISLAPPRKREKYYSIRKISGDLPF